jgi:hypothetical protein
MRVQKCPLWVYRPASQMRLERSLNREVVHHIPANVTFQRAARASDPGSRRNIQAQW